MTVRFVDEFRDGNLAKTLAHAIRSEVKPDRTYNLMEFCGGHTHAIYKHGIVDLLPPPSRRIRRTQIHRAA